MAIEDQMKAAPVSNEVQMTNDQEKDLEIGVLLAKQLIDKGGSEVITAAEKSSDPGQVIGQFLMQLASQMNEELPQDGKLDPVIFLAEGGWLEQISDFLQEEYGIKREVADRAEIYVATTSQQMSEAKAQQAMPVAPQAQPMAPPAIIPQAGPQGAM